MFFLTENSRIVEVPCLESVFNPSVTQTVETLNTSFKNNITTPKDEIYTKFLEQRKKTTFTFEM